MVHPLVEAATPHNATKIPWLISLPYGNDTSTLRSTIAHAWVNSPNIRGTMDIIQSCVLTLVACIYTALHLNVPAYSAWYSVSWIKFTWVILALFAPEIVVFTAAEQLRKAWQLKKELGVLQQGSEDPKIKNASMSSQSRPKTNTGPAQIWLDVCFLCCHGRRPCGYRRCALP
jgi:hypothetical protein